VQIHGLRNRLSRSDKDAIRDLIVSYASAVDDGTETEILDLFTDDVVIEGPLSGRHTGLDGVRAWLRSVPDRPPGQDRHILTNIAVSGTKTDATAHSYYLHLRTSKPADGSASATEVFYTGRFEWSVRHVRGRWLISRRVAIIDSLAR
jgi:ketosteroid isomerase-like protein